MNLPTRDQPEAPTSGAFDSYAASYDAALEQGIAVSGEPKEYFARGRVAWLKRRLDQLQFHPVTILDFGCGTGTATPFFQELFQPGDFLGVDVSARSLERARRAHGSAAVRFLLLTEHQPLAAFDLAYCNGVFHHIRPAEREAALRYVARALRPGALFALWENNPRNPGTRYVMSRIPFDRDAIPLTPFQTRTLLRQGGFEVLRTDFLFIFPRLLRWLRFLEPPLAALPLGAQYLVLGRKPAHRLSVSE